MNAANTITAIRIALIPLVIGFLYQSDPLLNGLVAGTLFLCISLTDILDGYWARRLSEVSDLGKLLDPLADKLLVCLVLIALVGLGKVSALPVMFIIGRELFIAGLRSQSMGEDRLFSANILGKTKTVLQMLAVTMLIFNITGAPVVLWGAVFLSWLSAVSYLL
ncbi:MAG: CDP-diacylglycerol--glycerol-3-phosphate 3-phosphatidyltransferase [Candidatus Margulisiibacteriota bacterium]